MAAAAPPGAKVHVRRTLPEDFDAIVRISRLIYGDNHWRERQLLRNTEQFPEGQLVAVGNESGRVVGMAASLIILWDDYDADESWETFTDQGRFTNHDPDNGRTLYGAEVMVDPTARRLGVGSALYRARQDLVRELGLQRIRAHSRLAGYHRVAGSMSARDYVRAVEAGELTDPTLSFQLAWGFRVLTVVSEYLREDPRSLGYAALIEWLNPEWIEG